MVKISPLCLSIIMLAYLDIQAHASIDVRNGCGHDIRFSFHGDGCRTFDSDRFNYQPCAEKIIQANETAHFPDFRGDGEALSKKEKAIVPRIIFSSFGFSYLCKLRDYVVSQVCSIRAPFKFAQCPKKEETPIQKPVVTHPNTLLLLHTTGLTITENYYLEILAEHGYFPQPYVDCRLTHLRDSQTFCPEP